MGAHTMDIDVCVQCGKVIEGKGIRFRNRHFCSDECCEEWEELSLEDDEPIPEELAVDDEEIVEDLEDLDDLDELDDLEDLDDLDDDF